MKRTFSKHQLNVTFIDPVTREFSERVFNTSFNDVEKAKKDFAKHSDINDLVAFDFRLTEVEGKTYELPDYVFAAYAHTEDKAKPTDFYKTIEFCPGYYRYISLDSDITFRVDTLLPIKDTLNFIHTKVNNSGYFVYKIRYASIEDVTPIKMYMSDEQFIELSKKYSK